MKHVKHMLYAVLLEVVVAFILFAILGIKNADTMMDHVEAGTIMKPMSKNFMLGFITLIPVRVLVCLFFTGKP